MVTEWHWMVTEWSLKCTCHSVDWRFVLWVALPHKFTLNRFEIMRGNMCVINPTHSKCPIVKVQYWYKCSSIFKDQTKCHVSTFLSFNTVTELIRFAKISNLLTTDKSRITVSTVLKQNKCWTSWRFFWHFYLF